MMYFAKSPTEKFVLLKKGHAGWHFRAETYGANVIVASLEEKYRLDVEQYGWEVLAVLPEELVQ